MAESKTVSVELTEHLEHRKGPYLKTNCRWCGQPEHVCDWAVEAYRAGLADHAASAALDEAKKALADIADGDATRWQWSDDNQDMQSFYFITAGEEMIKVAEEALARIAALQGADGERA